MKFKPRVSRVPPPHGTPSPGQGAAPSCCVSPMGSGAHPVLLLTSGVPFGVQRAGGDGASPTPHPLSSGMLQPTRMLWGLVLVGFACHWFGDEEEKGFILKNSA